MAASQLCCERNGNSAGKIRLREVVDVVVLGDDEALPLPVGSAIDLAVQLQDHRSLIQRQLGGIRVRYLDQPPTAIRSDVAELPAPRPRGQVGHDIELLPRFEECCLQCDVVARRHDQLMWHAALPQDGGSGGEEPVHRSR